MIPALLGPLPTSKQESSSDAECPPVARPAFPETIPEVKPPNVDAGGARCSQSKTKTYVAAELRFYPVEPRTAVVDERCSTQAEQAQELVYQKNSMLERSPYCTVAGE